MLGLMRNILKRYTPEFFLDSIMCHGDPFFIERGYVAWLDHYDIRCIWDYVMRFQQEYGDLPPHSDETMHDIAQSEGISYNVVDRWLGYCLNEARQPPGEKRTPPFRFVDEPTHD